MNERLQLAIDLRNQQEYEKSREILVELAEGADDPLVHYHCGWTHDNLGLETTAIPHYEKAIALGLAGEDLLGCLLALGSSYRAIGEYETAERVLAKALETFPDDDALPVFLALTQYNLRNHAEAMKLLLQALVRTTASERIKRYERALLFYSDKLDQTWK